MDMFTGRTRNREHNESVKDAPRDHCLDCGTCAFVFVQRLFRRLIQLVGRKVRLKWRTTHSYYKLLLWLIIMLIVTGLSCSVYSSHNQRINRESDDRKSMKKSKKNYDPFSLAEFRNELLQDGIMYEQSEKSWVPDKQFERRIILLNEYTTDTIKDTLRRREDVIYVVVGRSIGQQDLGADSSISSLSQRKMLDYTNSSAIEIHEHDLVQLPQCTNKVLIHAVDHVNFINRRNASVVPFCGSVHNRRSLGFQRCQPISRSAAQKYCLGAHLAIEIPQHMLPDKCPLLLGIFKNSGKYLAEQLRVVNTNRWMDSCQEELSQAFEENPHLPIFDDQQFSHLSPDKQIRELYNQLDMVVDKVTMEQYFYQS